MFIKYLNNIYNLNNYYSIVKDVGVYANKKSAIHLIKNDNHFISLEFDNIEIRNFILMKIWEELKNHTECFDVDEELKLYLISKKYNL